MDLAECISVATSIITAGAAVFTACIAWRGLNTWKEQMKAKSDRELARRLLHKVYLIRDRIQSIRGDIFSVSELQEQLEKQGSITDEGGMLSAKVEADIYHKRWGQVESDLSGLEEMQREASVIWEDNIEGRLQPIRRAARKLKKSLWRYLTLRRASKWKELIEEDQTAEIEDVIHKLSSSPELDDFTAEIESAVEDAEDCIRLYLNP